MFAGAPIIAHPKTYDYTSQRKEELVPFFSGQRVIDLAAAPCLQEKSLGAIQV